MYCISNKTFHNYTSQQRSICLLQNVLTFPNCTTWSHTSESTLTPIKSLIMRTFDKKKKTLPLLKSY